MKKRIVSVFLIFTIIFINTLVLGAEGDIIHTGLKKIYRKDSPLDMEELLQDILDGEDVEKFYRETDDGKFINIVEEDRQQMEKLEGLFREEGITSPEEMRNYIINNKESVEEILSNLSEGLAQPFDDIRDQDKDELENYQGASNAPILPSAYYSNPEPGSRENTSKIESLNLPGGATKYMIKIEDKEVKPMTRDSILNGGLDYIRGRDIEVELGQYLVLYAVDRNNRIKAYVNILIVEDMVLPPKEEAPRLKIASISPGKLDAGSVIIGGLDGGLAEGASKWQVLPLNEPISPIYVGDRINQAEDYEAGQEIILASEDEIHKLDGNLKKYLILAASDSHGGVLAYKEFALTGDNLAQPASLLEEGVDYERPIAGEEDGTTKITLLNSDKAWTYEIYDERPWLPANERDTFGQEVDGEIEASPGQYLLLLASENNKITSYGIIELDESMIKAVEAAKIDDDIELEKGAKANTTKIVGLNIANVEGDKWMYRVGEDLQPPILDKELTGSKDYESGQDIEIEIGQDLLILATDKNGRVKEYMVFEEVSENEIRDASALELKLTTHYKLPEKGSEPGTTSFDFLNYDNAESWAYLVSEEEIGLPEINSGRPDGAEDIVFNNGKSTEDIRIFNENDPILKSDGVFRRNMAVYALDGDKIIAYKNFQLDNSKIRLAKAGSLSLGDNYSSPIKGNAPNSTRFEKLDHQGLEDTTSFAYKFIDQDEMDIEFNEVIANTRPAYEARDILPVTGDYLLLLALGRGNMTKYYTIIGLDEDMVRADNAGKLVEKTHYTGPIAGSVEASTSFNYLKLPSGASKWMYKISEERSNYLEAGVKLDGAEDYEHDENRDIGVSINDYLLLLATNEEGKLVAYEEFRLMEDHINGGNAMELAGESYELSKGSLPSTTSFSKLEALGLENPTSIRWMVKPLADQGEPPLVNSLIEGAETYIKGRDIQLHKLSEDSYGYILLLATDNRNRVKGYAYVEIGNEYVREHAPELDDVFIGEYDDDTPVDSTTIEGLELGKEYAYLLDNRPYPVPALGDDLPQNAKKLEDENHVGVRLGQYLSIFELDENSKILAYKSFEIQANHIKQGNAKFRENEIELLEGTIVNGGALIEIELEGAQWAPNLKQDKSIRDRLFRGLEANNQTSQLTKLVDSLIDDGGGAININDEQLTIRLPETRDYDIENQQEVSLNLAPQTIENAINPIRVEGSIIIKPTIGARLAGDLVEDIVREKDIRAGGKTIIIELEDGSWVTDVDSSDKYKELIGGFQVLGMDEPEDSNWQEIVDEITGEDIRRNTSRKLTITLPPVEDVDYGSNKETLKLIIKKELLEGAGEDVEATPSFTIYPDVLQLAGQAVEDENLIRMEAPDNRVPLKDKDIWKIKLETGTLREDISDKDIDFINLPRGLKANIDELEGQTISIRVSGTASSAIKQEQNVYIRIKGSAVTEPNSMDSGDIAVKIQPGQALDLDLVGYKLVEEDGQVFIYLTNVSEEMDYSINSSNGLNGDWEKIILEEDSSEIKIDEARPMKIWVREGAQSKVFAQVADLVESKAPASPYIESVDYQDAYKLKVAGIGQAEDYQYSLDGGSSWEDLDSSLEIELDADSDLRMRLGPKLGEGGVLASQATRRLNGLYLGDVDLNVAAGKIENTNTSMQYSLNSSNGKDGTWATGKNGESLVGFQAGNDVWIREGRSDFNFRFLGQVGIKDKPDLEEDTIEYSIVGKKIINNYEDGDLEYRMAGGSWKALTQGENGGIDFLAGEIEVRLKGDQDNLASHSQTLANIPPPIDPPELRADDDKKTISYLDVDGTWKPIDNSFQYRISLNGPWKSGEEFANDGGRMESVEIFVRKKASEKSLASKEKSFNFTKDLVFEDLLSLNVAKGQLNGSSNKLEYLISSTNQPNGQWITASNGTTNLDFYEGMYLWIREKGKPSKTILLIEELERQALSQEDVQDGAKVYRSIEKDKIANFSANNLEYRLNDGKGWIRIDAGQELYDVGFVPGKFEFRLRAKEDMLESHPVTRETIQAAASPPVVTYNDVKNIVESINGKSPVDWINFEYRIDNRGAWLMGQLLEAEDLSGRKDVHIRIRASTTRLASQERIISFTENLDLELVRLSSHLHPLELNGTTRQMEYRVIRQEGGQEYTHSWKEAEEGNTSLPEWVNENNLVKVEIRDKNQIENSISIELE